VVTPGAAIAPVVLVVGAPATVGALACEPELLLPPLQAVAADATAMAAAISRSLGLIACLPVPDPPGDRAEAYGAGAWPKSRRPATHGGVSDGTPGPISSPPVAPSARWPAAWYRDPWLEGQQRYWDGTAWTPHVQPGTTEAAPPETDATSEWAPAATAASSDPYAPAWASGSGSSSGGWLSSEQAPPPPRQRRRGSMFVVALVVVAAVAAGVTIASGSGAKRRAASAPPTSVPAGGSVPSTTVPAPASNDPNAKVLTQLVVRQSDVPSNLAVGLIPGGNLVAGQVTLDLCNGTYPSEALRTAREQVDVADQTGQSVLSTEAVLYHNAAGTAQAFSELQARAASCPQQFLPPPPGEEGFPATKTTFNARPDTTWATTPTVERQAYDFTSTDQQGNTSHSIAVYLRHGRALMGLYFPTPDQAQPSVDGQTTVPGIVSVFEKRMAALPPTVVNATVKVSGSTGTI
jgi:hypothetical protein